MLVETSFLTQKALVREQKGNKSKYLK